MSPDPSPEKFTDLVLKYHPNHFSVGPMHINALMDSPKAVNEDLSYIITASYGGDSTSAEWEEKVRSFLFSHRCRYGVLSGYGLSEMASAFATKYHASTAMFPFARNNVKIIDLDTGEELSYGKEGEVCVSGPTMMCGYYQRQDETNELIWQENGVRWMHTGDLGYVTSEGHLYISGRLKRIFCSKSTAGIVSRVFPMKIERVIDKHYAVKKSAVVGKRDDRKGYCIIAYIVLGLSIDEHVLQNELQQLCISELDDVSQPEAFIIVTKLPHTKAGKIDYRALEERAKAECVSECHE